MPKYNREEIEKKIQHLERGWSNYDPTRRVFFKLRFMDNPVGNRKFNSKSVCEDWERYLIENDFEIEKYHCDIDEAWIIIAYKTIILSTENIMRWTDIFHDQFNGDGKYFDDWGYPKVSNVDFHPYYDFKSNYGAARNRARVLFENALISDPLSSSVKENFDIQPRKFLQAAMHAQPKNPEPTASAFAQWVYSLYASAYGDEQDRQRGKEIEKWLENLRLRSFTSIDSNFLKKEYSDWKIIHTGIDNGNNKYFSVESLVVNGINLKASPDLVYENVNTGEVIIVEIKSSYMALPKNLWPNVWAQLWCYSQIEIARKAPKITVVAEVWTDRFFTRRNDSRVVSLRSSVRRDPRSPAFDKFFRRLFEVYSGVISRDG